MDEWVTLRDFLLYEVNQDGVIRHKRTKHVKKPRVDGWGYHQVSLSKGEHGKNYSKTVHRIVANAFIPGEHSDQQVNHKDGNKTNNHISNLEFVNGSENVQHAYDTGIRKPSGGRGPIRGVRIVETGMMFDNMADCARFVGGDSGNVCRAAHDPTKTYKGFHYELI